MADERLSMHEPFHHLELADLQLEMAHQDMQATHFDPTVPPKKHMAVDEPVTDDFGDEFDIMTHTPDATADLLEPL